MAKYTVFITITDQRDPDFAAAHRDEFDYANSEIKDFLNLQSHSLSHTKILENIPQYLVRGYFPRYLTEIVDYLTDVHDEEV